VTFAVELLCGTWERKERKREKERVNKIKIHYICAGIGHDDIY
jgi:hypothetical protein